MGEMNVSETIDRPLAEIFAFFLNVDETAGQTDPYLASVTKTPEGPTQPGTTFRFRSKAGGKVRETTTRYTAIETNRKIEFDARIGPMRPRCSLTFEPTEEGTRVIFRGQSKPVGVLRPLSPLFNRKGEAAWGERLTRIKAVLEASNTERPSAESLPTA